jgi:hypothetical protein
MSKGVGTELFEKTKIPFRKKTTSPAMTEAIMNCQLIIKEFEMSLLELAQDGDESAIDALMYSNTISVGMTANKFGGIISGMVTIKNSGS